MHKVLPFINLRVLKGLVIFPLFFLVFSFFLDLWGFPSFWFISGSLLGFIGTIYLICETLSEKDYYMQRQGNQLVYYDRFYDTTTGIGYKIVKFPTGLKRIILALVLILEGFLIQISGHFVEMVLIIN